MDNQCYRTYRIYVIAAGVLSLIAGIAVTMFNYTFYDFELTLYKHGAPSYAVYMIAITAIIFFATVFFTLKTDRLPLRYPKKNSLLTEVALLLSAASIVGSVIFQLIFDDTDRLVRLFYTESEMVAAASFLLKASVVLAIVAAVYYVIAFVTEKVMPVLSILAGIWTLVYMMRVYYDMTTVVMDPIRMMTIASAAACALFIIAETRIGIGKPAPRYYVFAGLTASFVCFMSGFSKAALFFAGATRLEVQTAYDLFELFFAVYAFSRLLAFMKYESFTETEKTRSSAAVSSSIALPEEKSEEAPIAFDFFEELKVDINVAVENVSVSESKEESAPAEEVVSLAGEVSAAPEEAPVKEKSIFFIEPPAESDKEEDKTE